MGIDLPSLTKTMIDTRTKAGGIESIISNGGQITEVEKVILLVVPCTNDLVHVEPVIDHL